MDFKKVNADLVLRLLPRNFWQTHLVESTGKNKSLKDIRIHNIIQAIQIESIKPIFQYTNIVLLKRQSAPQWSEGIRTYSSTITKD